MPEPTIEIIELVFINGRWIAKYTGTVTVDKNLVAQRGGWTASGSTREAALYALGAFLDNPNGLARCTYPRCDGGSATGYCHESCKAAVAQWKEDHPAGPSPALTFSGLAEANARRSTEGFNHPLHKWSLLEWGGATSGEIGEACNVAKKMLRYRDNLRGNKAGETLDVLRAKLGNEVADGIIYSILWLVAAGINPEEAIRKAFNDKSDEIGSSIKI